MRTANGVGRRPSIEIRLPGVMLIAMSTHKNDRQILRRLAKRVSEIAALPVQRERAELIKSVNELRPLRPVVLAFPEGGWRDLITDADLGCADPLLREWERALLMRIFTHEKIGDDQPIVDAFNIRWAVDAGNYGLATNWNRPDNHGAAKWDAPVKTEEDFASLRLRTPKVNREETLRLKQLADDMFGDILKVKIHGSHWWTLGLTMSLIYLRGLDQVMMDLYDRPEFVHKMMAFLRDSTMGELDYYERENLLSLNNGPADYVGSGGLGYTSELPAMGSNGHVRTRDMWCLGESQEFVGVGPEQFNEFALQYQLPLMQRFGLVCYGCCEPLDKKFDLVISNIPNLRRVSVSAWCDRSLAAAKLGNRYVYSWKPNPAMICGPEVRWDEVEQYTRHTLDVTKGCCVEMIMKDTHTFSHDPTRIGKWAKMARRLVDEMA